MLAAKIQTTLTQEDLVERAQSGLESVVFQMVDACCLLTLNSNALDVWRAHEQGEALPALVDVKPTYALCSREAFLPRWLELDEAQACVIKAIQAGKTFASICESLCQYIDQREVPSLAIRVLQMLTTARLLALPK